jgi:hypothetical protein
LQTQPKYCEANMSEPSYEDLKARVADLEKQAAAGKSASKSGGLEFRVSEKGAVSVYGLGRFPVTLYYEQWTRLLGEAEALRAFLEEHKGRLKRKDAGAP